MLQSNPLQTCHTILDPQAFNPIFEKALSNYVLVPLPTEAEDAISVDNEHSQYYEQTRYNKRGSLDEVNTTNLQRPHVSPRNSTNKKTCPSAEAMVL